MYFICIFMIDVDSSLGIKSMYGLLPEDLFLS